MRMITKNKSPTVNSFNHDLIMRLKVWINKIYIQFKPMFRIYFDLLFEEFYIIICFHFYSSSKFNTTISGSSTAIVCSASSSSNCSIRGFSGIIIFVGFGLEWQLIIQILFSYNRLKKVLKLPFYFTCSLINGLFHSTVKPVTVILP